VRIKGKKEKWVLREAMKGLLPKVLYEREKFAFMAPPAHSDPKKWQAVQALFKQLDDPDTTDATRNTMEAVFNHMLGAQLLHSQFVATDVPDQALAKAKSLGRSHQETTASA
jgi:asparagine synthase (glutamine-hydrolysing)